MLEELVSAEAAALYQQLLDSGGLPLDGEGQQGIGLHEQRVQELVGWGFAFDVAGGQGRLIPQAPIVVFQQVLSKRQQHIDTELDTLAKAYRELEQAQRVYTQAIATSGDMARVLTDPDEITSWADHLRFSASWECLFLEPLPTLPLEEVRFQKQPAERRDRGVRYRSVWAREWLATTWATYILDQLQDSGEEARFLPGVNFKMRIADDHTALVALQPQALDRSLLIQAPHFVAALRQLFEYLWDHAAAVSGNTTPYEHTHTQQTILRLLAAGLKDEAIARAIGLSVKTVRRHIANLFHQLGADTRFAAGVEATRRGWLTETSSSSPRPRD